MRRERNFMRRDGVGSGTPRHQSTRERRPATAGTLGCGRDAPVQAGSDEQRAIQVKQREHREARGVQTLNGGRLSRGRREERNESERGRGELFNILAAGGKERRRVGGRSGGRAAAMTRRRAAVIAHRRSSHCAAGNCLHWRHHDANQESEKEKKPRDH
jgi:hypothetical protein